MEVEAQDRGGLYKDLKGRVSDRVALNLCLVDIICLAERYTNAPVNRIQIVGRSGAGYNRPVA